MTRKTILLADDEESLRVLVHETLEDPDCDIVEATDGEEALAMAHQLRPALAVLDWMMPGMTGPEVTARLKQDPATRSIPVILLTAKGQESDRAAGRDAGADAYLIKPFSPLELLDEVSRLLGSSSGEAA